MSNNSGSEDTLTAFLAEMDGFKTDPSKPVFVLAATNFNVEPGTAKSLALHFADASTKRFISVCPIRKPEKHTYTQAEFKCRICNKRADD